jgi:hypothetical protein
VGVGFHRPEVVDDDDLDILASALEDGAQGVTANAAEPVDGYADCHASRSRLMLPRVTPELFTDMTA